MHRKSRPVGFREVWKILWESPLPLASDRRGQVWGGGFCGYLRILRGLANRSAKFLENATQKQAKSLKTTEIPGQPWEAIDLTRGRGLGWKSSEPPYSAIKQDRSVRGDRSVKLDENAT